VLAATLAYARLADPEPDACPENPVFRLTLGPSRIVLGELHLPPVVLICGGQPPREQETLWLPDIEREIEALGRDHPWAGEYLADGRRLVLAPRCGAWKESGGCTRTGRVHCDTYEGTVAILTCGEAYVSVQWGPRHYLIEQGEWERFVRDVRSGEEPRHAADGSFLLRAPDASLPVNGSPWILGAP
jgi:hypothetical protein